VTQLQIDFARSQRDEAMQRAVDAANGRVPKWSEVALQYIRLYAQQHRGERFIGRDITQAAKVYGLESPSSPKAWGSPIQKAVEEGILRKVGFSQDANRHCSPVPMYEAA
jgi:hypothetical protein